MSETDALIADLEAAREEFLGLLAGVAPESMTTPGLVGEWSAREILAHLGYWAGHATELIHAVETGRIAEVGLDEPPVDEINATVARVAMTTPLATVRRREAASVEALADRLRAFDPALLGQLLPDGSTVEQGIREDGANHYREHAAEMRRVLEAPANG